jgi:hypothetical protein
MATERRLILVATALDCVIGGGAHAAFAEPMRGHWRVVNLPVPRGARSSYAEPGIAFGPHGSVVASAATANTGAPPTFWTSRNSGGTWATGRDFDTTGASAGDADAAIGADGSRSTSAYNANPPGQPTNPTVLVFSSRDGRTWSGPASFPAPHGADQPDRPWLIVNPRRGIRLPL